MEKMDGWNAPQWADFDASVMSDVDQYFDVEHEELESVQSVESQYHSCPSTPIKSKKSLAVTPSKTPKSGLNDTSQELTGCMKNLRLSSEKKFIKVESSMTPRAYVLKKSITKCLTPRVVKIESVVTTKVSETSLSDVEKIAADSEIAVGAEELVETTEFPVKVEDDNVDQNSTLVASSDSDENSCDPTSPVIDKISTEQAGKTMEKPEISDKPEDTEIPVAVSSMMKNLDEISISTKKTEDNEKFDEEKSDEEKARLAKLQSRLDPSKRSINENRKNLRAKPTVLTSHARRQSISRYRRVSNKYVSLAEAVSKFQNGTPERFRSSNNKKPSNNAVGPLQKVKNTVMKLTCATSPLLRCKYRTRAISVPNHTEREIMKIEEIRKNRIKPNPIRQSVMNPMKKIKTTTRLPETTTGTKKTTINKIEALTKIDKKPIAEALPSSQKTVALRGQKTLKKSDEPTKIDVDSSKSQKMTMKPPKTLENIVKTTKISDVLSRSRRTMINPPISLEKINNPATILQTLSTSRRTMMNPPKFSDSLTTKTTICQPEKSKNLDNSKKLFVESFTTYDKKKDPSISMNCSMLPETARKPHNTPCKKTVPTVVSTDEGVAIKDIEILHFGIPVGSDYKKITKTQPFSFDSRNKELQNKREKLKNRQIEEDEKKTKIFHARPVPSYVAKSSFNVAKQSGKPLVTGNAPFSFQQRNELLLKKKKEIFEQMVEREKKARIFHAKPAPSFKPVFVRGNSAENLRTNNPTDKETLKATHDIRQRGLSQGSINDNRENTAPNVPANQQFPKFKNPLVTQNRKIKKTAM